MNTDMGKENKFMHSEILNNENSKKVTDINLKNLEQKAYRLNAIRDLLDGLQDHFGYKLTCFKRKKPTITIFTLSLHQ